MDNSNIVGKNTVVTPEGNSQCNKLNILFLTEKGSRSLVASNNGVTRARAPRQSLAFKCQLFVRPLFTSRIILRG
ncbi:hypothetical protein KPH14_006541 [Odynerus spinipes]|uniref:Uncharacterized protein n=1 Tax=Odynerus spinipes TaxID=1348599 RepID=A0AAD9RQX8_9HYME|nr:hypothetical protein KPH14_006541 [Odynerus spinipes]